MQKEKLTKEHIAEDLDRYARWSCTTQDDRPFWGMTASALLAVLCGFLVRPWVAIPFAVLSVGSWCGIFSSITGSGTRAKRFGNGVLRSRPQR